MMVSKDSFETFLCKNVPTNGKFGWKPITGRTKARDNTRCTDLGEHYAGPFGESADSYHLFYEFLPKIKKGLTHNCILN